MTSRLSQFIFLLLTGAALLAFASSYLNQDLWYDEFMSLNTFALKGFSTTTTVYSSTNNHILFNLYAAAASRVLDYREIYDWMDKVYLFRALQLAIGFLTVAFTFKFARDFLDRTTAYVAIIVLVTSIPFLNFAMQLRGYGFSMLFAISMTYFTWRYARDGRIFQLALMILSGFFLLYTIPSNIFFATSLGLLWTYRWISALKRKSRAESKRTLILLAGLVGCAVLAALAYLPVVDDMLKEPNLNRVPADRMYVFTGPLPSVFSYFLSARFVLLLAFLAGLVGLEKVIRKQRGLSSVNRMIYPLLFLLLCPFLLAFLTNRFPFQRNFLSLIPIFAIVIALPVSKFITNLRLSSRREVILVAGVYAYCIVSAFWQLNVVQGTLDNNLSKTERVQDMYYNYYLADNYIPGKSAALLAARQASTPGPIVLMDPFDRMSMSYYLKRHRLESYRVTDIKKTSDETTHTHVCWVENSTADPNEKRFRSLRVPMTLTDYPEEAMDFGLALSVATKINPGANVYVIAAYAEEFESLFDKYFQEAYTLERLNDFTSSSNVFMLTKRPGA